MDDDDFNFFLTKISIPVVFSILASLLVALLFVPLAASGRLRSEAERAELRPSRLSRLADRFYHRVMDPLHRFYLVVPDNGTAEGSYGADSGGSPRPGGVSACRAARNNEACGSSAPQGQVVVSCAAIQAASDVVRSNPSESVP